jgi:hypothetical protein
MKAESVGMNPFQLAARNMYAGDTSREDLIKKAPWNVIRFSVNMGEWEACLASIGKQVRGYHSGNKAWETETLEILQAYPSAKNGGLALEWYLKCLFGGETIAESRERRIAQLFAVPEGGSWSIVDHHWSAFNRFLKEYPEAYWMHPRIRQIFADRLRKPLSALHTQGRSISQSDIDEIEQALRRIVAVNDGSFVALVNNLLDALKGGRVGMATGNDDPFALPRLTALLETTRNHLLEGAGETPGSLGIYLDKLGLPNVQVKFSPSIGLDHQLRFVFDINAKDPTLPISDLTDVGILFGIEGFETVEAFEAGRPVPFSDTLYSFQVEASKLPVTIIGTPRILNTQGRIFYGARIMVQVSYQHGHTFIAHYHCHDSGPVKLTPKPEVIRISLPPRGPAEAGK